MRHGPETTADTQHAVESLLDAIQAQVAELGTLEGEDAAGWAAENLWSRRHWSATGATAQATAFLESYYTAPDALMGPGWLLRAPDLSGEWADERTPRSLLAEVVPSGITVDPDTEDELCQTWLDAAEAAYWSALVRGAERVLSCSMS